MGRKIPGKKHRTIKDPAKQRETYLEKIKNKINNPPKNSDVQEIPKSLLHLMALKKSAQSITSSKLKKKKSSKRKKRRNELMCIARVLDKYPDTKSTGYIPNIVQKPGETSESFLRRVNAMTQSMIDEVNFEKQFNVQINRNEETGEVVEVKKVKLNKKSKKKTLSEKRKEKLLKKKQNINNFKDFNQLKDNVKFGEVVERPPNLPSLEKNKKIGNATKAKYNSLILSQMEGKKLFRQQPKSLIEKEKAENERRFIVEAYKKAKSQRR